MFSRTLLSVAMTVGGLLAPAAALGAVIPEQDLELAGLERMWVAQAMVDPASGGEATALVHGAAVYVMTSRGVVQAFDAETGATRWTHQYGDPTQPSYGPVAHTRLRTPLSSEVDSTDRDVQKEADAVAEEVLIAMINGSTLYLLDDSPADGKTGRPAGNGLILRRAFTPSISALSDSNTRRSEGERNRSTRLVYRLAGAPGGAPAIVDRRVFVSLIDGRVVGLPHDGERGIPWKYDAGDQSYTAPTPVRESKQVVWTAIGGYLYGVRRDGGGVTFRFRGAAELVGPPAAHGTLAIVPTMTGILYGVDSETGRQRYRTSVGGDIKQPAIAVGDRVYVGSELPALHAFDPRTGAKQWRVEGVNQLVSVAGDRVYATSPDGRLAVIEVADDGVSSRWISSARVTPIANTVNDRLYFASASGAIQCVREKKLESPRTHGASASDPEAPGEAGADDAPAESDDPFAVQDEPNDEPVIDDPFAAEDDPFAIDDADEPDGGPDNEPADDPFADDPFADPFE